MTRTKKILILVYAGFYAFLAYAIYLDNTKLGYPSIFILLSAIMQSLVAVGIVLSTYDALDDRLTGAWRLFFPLMTLELAVGIGMDAVMPTDFSLKTHGATWVINALINLTLVAPAYYLNFKLARY